MPNQSPLKITKGTPIVIPTNSIHMDAKYYPDPETFNPERFTEEENAKRPKYAYLPFGEGPKKCMGKVLEVYLQETNFLYYFYNKINFIDLKKYHQKNRLKIEIFSKKDK